MLTSHAALGADAGDQHHPRAEWRSGRSSRPDAGSGTSTARATSKTSVSTLPWALHGIRIPGPAAVVLCDRASIRITVSQPERIPSVLGH
jgi:hypothetical protein